MPSKIGDCPNVEERCEETHLPDEVAALNKDLQSLSGKELYAFLERWKTLLLGDSNYTPLIFPVFSKVSRKVNGITPMGDNLSFLDFLAQLKRALFSCDIFGYEKEVYDEYVEGIYRLAGNCSYYLKPDLLEEYASNEIEKYEEVRKIFEEHYNGMIIEWLEIDRNERVHYLPSLLEIRYLMERTQDVIREDGNVDKALFFLYRTMLLSLKRLMSFEVWKSRTENEELLNILLDMITLYQSISDEMRALETLEYVQKVVVSELVAQNFLGNDPDIEKENTEKEDAEEYTQDTYGDIRRKILWKKAYIQKELYLKKKDVTKEEALAAYQEVLFLSESIFGTNSLQAEQIRQDIAEFRSNSGEQGEVLVLLEQLKTAEEKKDTEELESLYGRISEVYEGMEDFDHAILYYQKKVIMIKKKYGKDSNIVADYYNRTGKLYEKAGRFSEACDCYERALKNCRGYLLRTQEEDADDPEMILKNFEKCLYLTGTMYLTLSKYEKALSHFQEVLNIYDSRCEHGSRERADYLKALAEAYEKMQFMGKACHYYLWAWDGYQTVAELHRLREGNAVLHEEEIEICAEKETQIRVHMQKIKMGRIFQPVEEIDYTALNTEEREYFLKRFGQLVRRRLREEDIWKNWIFQWRVYERLWREWQERMELDASSVLEEAFSVLKKYLRKELNKKVLIEFSEDFFDYLSEEEYEGEWEEEWEEEYIGFYDALEDFFHAILESDTDFRSFQKLICEELPLWAEAFTSVYYKEEGYTKYEKELRYQQVVTSSVFVRWIAEIQTDIRLLLSCQVAEELLGDE